MKWYPVEGAVGQTPNQMHICCLLKYIHKMCLFYLYLLCETCWKYTLKIHPIGMQTLKKIFTVRVYSSTYSEKPLSSDCTNLEVYGKWQLLRARVCGNTFFDQRYETTQNDSKKKLLFHSNDNWFLEFRVAVILLRQKRYKTIILLFCVGFLQEKR